VRARLTDARTGAPVTGGLVQLLMQDAHSPDVLPWLPTDWRTGGTYTTDATGTVSVGVSGGMNRRFAFVYYPTVDAATPVVSRRLLLRATTRVWMRPRVTQTSAHEFRFDATASAGGTNYMPTTGLVVALQVRNGARWVTARYGQTGSSGRVQLALRFPRSGRFRVRVVVPSQIAWPLYAGASNIIAFRVGVQA
jgi:hypothetical protein